MPKRAHWIEYGLQRYKATEIEIISTDTLYRRERIYCANVINAATGLPDIIIEVQQQRADNLKWGAIRRIKQREREKYLLKIATSQLAPAERDGQVVGDYTLLITKDPHKLPDKVRRELIKRAG